MILNNVMYFIKEIISEKNDISPFNAWNIIRYISLLIPHFSYSSCIAGFLETSWENKRCKICSNSPNVAEACK